jgi:hypothetical protein
MDESQIFAFTQSDTAGNRARTAFFADEGAFAGSCAFVVTKNPSVFFFSSSDEEKKSDDEEKELFHGNDEDLLFWGLSFFNFYF